MKLEDGEAAGELVGDLRSDEEAPLKRLQRALEHGLLRDLRSDEERLR